MMRKTFSLFSLSLIALLLGGCPTSVEAPAEWPNEDVSGAVAEHSELFVTDTEAPTHTVFETNDTAYWGPSGYTLWTGSVGSQDPFVSRTVSLMKASGVSGAGYGLVFCYGYDEDGESDTMLVVMVNNNGEYIIGEVVGAEFSQLVPWTETTSLTSGYNQANKISLARDVDGVFSLTINGVPETTFRDEAAPYHTGGGDGYIVVVSPGDDFPNESVHVEFWEQ